MNKLSAVNVIYKDNYNAYELYNITAIHKEHNICLFGFSNKKPKKYTSFQDMYAAILKTLKENGFYTSHYNDFGTTFYNILFIDLNNPYKFEKYAYRKEGLEYDA